MQVTKKIMITTIILLFNIKQTDYMCAQNAPFTNYSTTLLPKIYPFKRYRLSWEVSTTSQGSLSPCGIDPLPPV